MAHPSTRMAEAGKVSVGSKDVVNVRPTHLSSSEKIQFLELDEARLTLRYVGKGQHHHDVGISSIMIHLEKIVLIFNKLIRACNS